MATFTITVPDGEIQNLLDAFAWAYAIPMVPEDPEDPESPLVPEFTKGEWAKKKVRAYIRNIHRAYMSTEAAEAARQVAYASAEEFSEDWTVN